MVKRSASPTRSLKSVIIASTGLFPCHNKANFCITASTGFTVWNASWSFAIKAMYVGSMILLFWVIDQMYLSFHLSALLSVKKDSTKATFEGLLLYTASLMARYMAHS